MWAVHVPGVENGIADAISRNNLHLFYSQIPAARDCRTSIPVDLKALLPSSSRIGHHRPGPSCSGAVFGRVSTCHKAKLQVGHETLCGVLSVASSRATLSHIRVYPLPVCSKAPYPELVEWHCKELFGSCSLLTDCAGPGRPKDAWDGAAGVCH